MLTKKPMTNTGSAIARLGPMRVRISWPMSRPSSARPKSKTKSFTDFSKKMVRVIFPAPSAVLL